MKSVIYYLLASFAIIISLNETAANHGTQRRRRQVGDAGDALVDAVFQIPIQTLTAVGTLVKSSRPVIMQVRQRIQQNLAPPQRQPHRFSFPGSNNLQQTQQGNRRISSVYQPTSNYNRLNQQTTLTNNRVSSVNSNSVNQLYQPTSNYNRLYQQPNSRVSSANQQQQSTRRHTSVHRRPSSDD